MKYSSNIEWIATLWYGLKYNEDVSRYHPIQYSTEIREPKVPTEEPVRGVHQEMMAQFAVVPVLAEGAAEAGEPGVPSGPPEEVVLFVLLLQLLIQL